MPQMQNTNDSYEDWHRADLSLVLGMSVLYVFGRLFVP